MTEFNDIGISGKLDMPRIKKLLAIGLFVSVLHFVGDMILGWGTEDESLKGIFRILSTYEKTSNGGIFAAALLGLFGMLLEGLSYFGIYRMIAPYSPKYAHSYRAGVFGYLMFGACGFHVPTCALVYLTKHGFANELLTKYAMYFVLPTFVLFWIFFAVLQVTQIKAFAKGQTPCPKGCWVFSLPIGMAAPIVAAFNFVDTLSQVGTTVSQIDEILKAEEQEHGTQNVGFADHDIEVRNVSFGYHEGKEILHDVSLSVPQNGMTAFVGPSGSGKSTLAKLIAGFWDIKDGVITMGGQDLRKIPLAELYE